MNPKKPLEYCIYIGIRLGASDVAAEYVRVDTNMIRLANNEVSVFNSFSEDYVTIYIAFREKRAVSSTTTLSKKGLEGLVKRTASMALEAPPSDVYAPLPSGPFEYSKDLLRPSMRWKGHEGLIEWVEEGINAALNEGAARVAGSLTFHRMRRRLLTTAGIDVEEEKNCVELSLRAFTDKDASGQFATATAKEEEFDPGLVGKTAGEIAKLATKPVDGEPGEYDVVLGPMTTANLIEEVGYAASAYRVDAEHSFLVGKLGEKVAGDGLTLIDDPTLVGTYGSTAFDAEGRPTKRNVIIKDGVLTTYLHNSHTAKKWNVESTSNAGLIVPHPFNLIVDGKGSRGWDLLSKLDNGIFVTNDWYLRYQDVRAGDFSTIPRDGMFYVRKGSIERSIKGLRLSDNFLRILLNVEEVSSDRYWIKWWEVETPVCAPYLLVRGVRLTKSTF